MKYKLTKETKEVDGVKLYRIEATASFGDVEKGEKGGFIEKKENLSEEGNAWVSGNARVYGDACVYGDAWVSGKFKLEFGWCFARKQEDWNVSEIKNGDKILLIKDYKPATEDKPTLKGKEVEVKLDGITYRAIIQ